MAHVSRPVLFLIAAAAIFIAFWLVALRPKPVATSSTPLAPTQAIPKATAAAATSDAANAKVQAATDGDAAAQAAAAATAAPATASQKAATAKVAVKAVKTGDRRNDAVVRAISSGKVVVLLFWDAKSADDIATRGALRDLDRHGGKVVVRVASIDDVARYSAVTRGVKIAQSPTTVVIGRKGDARVIVGLSEPRELSQAVGDALAGR
jgi:hypothetical protein